MRYAIEDFAAECVHIHTAQGDKVFVLEQNIDEIVVDLRLKFALSIQSETVAVSDDEAERKNRHQPAADSERRCCPQPIQTSQRHRAVLRGKERFGCFPTGLVTLANPAVGWLTETVGLTRFMVQSCWRDHGAIESALDGKALDAERWLIGR
jgi:hypothetical protein